MYPKTHVILGGLLAILMYFIIHITILQAIVIFLASVLIDVDHYIIYIYETGNWNLKDCYLDEIKAGNRFKQLPKEEKKKYKLKHYILHGVEFLAIFLILSFFNIWFFFMFIGFFFHIALDLIDIYKNNDFFHSKISQIYLYFENKKKKLDFKIG